MWKAIEVIMLNEMLSNCPVDCVSVKDLTAL